MFSGLLLLAGSPLLFAYPQSSPVEVQGHQGPAVAPGTGASARFVGVIHDRYQVAEAMQVVTYVDGFYRAPGNEGYNASLDRVRKELEAAGFGKQPGFELEEILTPMRSPAWTPVSGRISVELGAGTQALVLHAFDAPGDPDRVMLPIHAPSADVRGTLVFDAADIQPGCILVTDRGLGSRAIARHGKDGAAAVLCSSNASFTIDPNGGDEHLDAIQFRTLSPSVMIPTAQISARTHARLRALSLEHGGIQLHFQAQVRVQTGVQLRTLVARVIGEDRPHEVVTMVSHVQEPGAGDNASGVGGLCQAAVTYGRLVQESKLPATSRTVAFVFGDEMRQSAIWLEHNQRKVIAGISADMLGQSHSRTGARCLLERSPDPGALDTLPPDKHTPWGAGRVSLEDLLPSAVSLIARVALVDTGLHVGGWHTSENPWEGGSDHDIFLARKIPAILIWHFTDFTYHTGLDRMSRLDGVELQRTSTALLATALTLADLRSSDLNRLRKSNVLERELRVASALEAERPDVAKRWREWCQGVDEWMHDACVDVTSD
ncbi:MAG: aminopeptidase YwaD [Candidatus Paceibacteria bacterium]